MRVKYGIMSVALSAEEKTRPLILMGHSKGTVDILQAVVTYPEVRDRVVAVVSVAGAVGGSPLADNAKQSSVDKLAHVPRSGCKTGDHGAIASLKPELRKNWLANNPLPDNIRYYTVIALPDPDHVSSGLKSAYRKIGKVDTRNDGQLIFYDQFIPSSTLLAFTNADHWAMSTPVPSKSDRTIDFRQQKRLPARGAAGSHSQVCRRRSCQDASSHTMREH